MRVTIKGSATSEHFKQIVDSLNEEFSKTVAKLLHE